ncbi:unnamed protein product [Caenorhabditis auriculariae]|uniref:Uncharacterized protein n=1 Tax=Caenorhabditis auriculariae TaxID=2777116 RepID=A0A8S1GRB9_9PELO|nr:unnamed protein product [Caenorhabditis auriculariae]
MPNRQNGPISDNSSSRSRSPIRGTIRRFLSGGEEDQTAPLYSVTMVPGWFGVATLVVNDTRRTENLEVKEPEEGEESPRSGSSSSESRQEENLTVVLDDSEEGEGEKGEEVGFFLSFLSEISQLNERCDQLNEPRHTKKEARLRKPLAHPVEGAYLAHKGQPKKERANIWKKSLLSRDVAPLPLMLAEAQEDEVVEARRDDPEGEFADLIAKNDAIETLTDVSSDYLYPEREQLAVFRAACRSPNPAPGEKEDEQESDEIVPETDYEADQGEVVVPAPSNVRREGECMEDEDGDRREGGADRVESPSRSGSSTSPDEDESAEGDSEDSEDDDEPAVPSAAAVGPPPSPASAAAAQAQAGAVPAPPTLAAAPAPGPTGRRGPPSRLNPWPGSKGVPAGSPTSGPSQSRPEGPGLPPENARANARRPIQTLKNMVKGKPYTPAQMEKLRKKIRRGY